MHIEGSFKTLEESSIDKEVECNGCGHTFTVCEAMRQGLAWDKDEKAWYILCPACKNLSPNQEKKDEC